MMTLGAVSMFMAPFRPRPGAFRPSVRSLAALALAAALLALGCGRTPEDQVARARLELDTSRTLGATLKACPDITALTYESFVDDFKRTIVQIAAEYDLARLKKGCLTVPAGQEPATRVFMTLRFQLEGDGATRFLDATIQSYSQKGYFTTTAAGLSNLADIYAGRPSLPCEALYVPGYL